MRGVKHVGRFQAELFSGEAATFERLPVSRRRSAHLTWMLVKQIWWMFLILAVIALIIGGLRLWVWWRNPWR